LIGYKEFLKKIPLHNMNTRGEIKRTNIVASRTKIALLSSAF